eukprot:259029-Prorocentrum_minimum.AAC.2
MGGELNSPVGKRPIKGLTDSFGPHPRERRSIGRSSRGPCRPREFPPNPLPSSREAPTSTPRLRPPHYYIIRLGSRRRCYDHNRSDAALTGSSRPTCELENGLINSDLPDPKPLTVVIEARLGKTCVRMPLSTPSTPPPHPFCTIAEGMRRY